MREPAFWNTKKGPEAAPLTRALLSPVSWLYRLGASLRRGTATAYEAPVPVICVGNASVGGTGKTPVTLALLDHFLSRGTKVYAVSKGYKGSLSGPHLVDPANDTAGQVGDEPLLLARRAPTIVAKARAAGVRAAVEAGAELILMDDGYQNPTVAKSLNILVIDTEVGFGNGKVVPAGPLREPAEEALARADLVVLMQPDKGEHKAVNLGDYAGPIVNAWLKPTGGATANETFAFAGIGRPNKFFDALARHGVQVVGAAAFPDHHTYSTSEINDLRKRANARGAQLITTEKDYVRLAPDLRRLVHAWPVIACFEDEVRLLKVLSNLRPVATPLGAQNESPRA